MVAACRLNCNVLHLRPVVSVPTTRRTDAFQFTRKFGDKIRLSDLLTYASYPCLTMLHWKYIHLHYTNDYSAVFKTKYVFSRSRTFARCGRRTIFAPSLERPTPLDEHKMRGACLGSSQSARCLLV